MSECKHEEMSPSGTWQCDHCGEFFSDGDEQVEKSETIYTRAAQLRQRVRDLEKDQELAEERWGEAFTLLEHVLHQDPPGISQTLMNFIQQYVERWK